MQLKRNISSLEMLSRVATVLVCLVLSVFTSCSTVSSKLNSGHVTQEGIRSAHELGGMATLLGLPFAVVGNVAVSAGKLLESGSNHEKKGHHDDAAGNYLLAAIDARGLLLQSREARARETEDTALQLHNASLAKFAEIWANDPRRGTVASIHLDGGGRHLEVQLDPKSDFEANFFDKAVAANSIRGKGVAEKKRKGYGAALVGIRQQLPERADEMDHYPENGLHLPLTLTISNVSEAGTGEDKRTIVTLALLDPYRHAKTMVGSRSMDLAADFAAPMLMLLSGRNEMVEGLFGFLDAENRAEGAGIYLFEPYDPDRIPVILTHGLIAVPIIWRDIVPELMSEPEISSRYQIFAFTYPSSYAIGESAGLFRSELELLRKKYDPEGRDPLSSNVVAIGHSMGGVLSHMLVTDFDDRIWKEMSDVPFEEFRVEAETRERLRSLAFFDPDPAVNRAVFISTPHRGADMAATSLVGLASQLVKLPANMIVGTTEILKGPAHEDLKVDLRKKSTSIQSLRTDSPILLAMDQSPYRAGVVYHSIIGDRGKGDTPDSSDGVVDYWSSHQEGAASELIVPTGHSAYTDPNAIEELKRILRLHAGLNSPGGTDQRTASLGVTPRE